MKPAARKVVTSGRRVVWRITPEAPHGEYVDTASTREALSAVSAEQPLRDVDGEPSAPGERSWLLSSFELADGLEVIDESDTLPSDLFDQHFRTG